MNSYQRRFHRKILILRDVQCDANAAMRKAFPIGSKVTWEHGNHLVVAEVLGHHDYDLRCVLIGKTGRPYMKSAESFVVGADYD